MYSHANNVINKNMVVQQVTTAALWLGKGTLFNKKASHNMAVVTGHGCTKLSNLEMEPKCVTKSDVQLIPDISRTKNDKRIL